MEEAGEETERSEEKGGMKDLMVILGLAGVGIATTVFVVSIFVAVFVVFLIVMSMFALVFVCVFGVIFGIILLPLGLILGPFVLLPLNGTN